MPWNCFFRSVRFWKKASKGWRFSHKETTKALQWKCVRLNPKKPSHPNKSLFFLGLQTKPCHLGGFESFIFDTSKVVTLTSWGTKNTWKLPVFFASQNRVNKNLPSFFQKNNKFSIPRNPPWHGDPSIPFLASRTSIPGGHNWAAKTKMGICANSLGHPEAGKRSRVGQWWIFSPQKNHVVWSWDAIFEQNIPGFPLSPSLEVGDWW